MKNKNVFRIIALSLIMVLFTSIAMPIYKAKAYTVLNYYNDTFKDKLGIRLHVIITVEYDNNGNIKNIPGKNVIVETFNDKYNQADINKLQMIVENKGKSATIYYTGQLTVTFNAPEKNPILTGFSAFGFGMTYFKSDQKHIATKVINSSVTVLANQNNECIGNKCKWR